MMIREIMTLREASKEWRVPMSTIHRVLVGAYERGEVGEYDMRRSGGTWLVTRILVIRYFGKIEEINNG